MNAREIAEKLAEAIPIVCDRKKRKPTKVEVDVFTLAQAYLDLLAKQATAMGIGVKHSPTIKEAGYVVVPVEPTEEMLRAGEEAVIVGANNHTGGCGKCHIDAYKAMIAKSNV